MTIRTRAGKGSELTITEGDDQIKTPIVAKTGAYTVVYTDNRAIIECTGTFTITLDDAATIIAACETSDFSTTIKNAGSGVITIATTGANTIDAQSTLVLGLSHLTFSDASVTLTINAAGTNFLSTAAAGISGGNTTSYDFYARGTTPQFSWVETGAAADESITEFKQDAGVLTLQYGNDAYDTFQSVAVFSRTGTTSDSINFVTTALQWGGKALARSDNAETISALWDFTTAPTINSKAIARSDNAETISALWDFTTAPTINSNTIWNTSSQQIKSKTANETVNNSVTLQDDDHLTGFTLVAGKRYKFRVVLKIINAGGAPGFAWQLVFTNATQSGWVTGIYEHNTNGVVMVNGNFTSADAWALVDTGVIPLEGGFQANASTGGTLKLQWAQETATVADTIITEDSYIELVQID